MEETLSWFSIDPGMIVALIGLAGAGFGYLFRLRLEKRENLKQSLYLLLEIWHRVTVLGWKSHDQLFQVIFDRLKERFPQARISAEEIEASKLHFVPILRKSMISHAFEDFDSLYEAHAEVVKLVAKSDPVLAYGLESSSNTRKRLAFIDDYLNESLAVLDEEGGKSALFSKAIKEETQRKFHQSVQEQLEKDLRALSFRVGIPAYFRTRVIIRKRHKRLQGATIEEIDEVVDLVVLVAMCP